VLPLVAAAGRVAQRDPAYAAAREAGQVGEKMDGYLGYVTPPSAALKAVVEDINLKRVRSIPKRPRPRRPRSRNMRSLRAAC
jgi:uncharacterized protein YdbL (DUF1318 family)